MNFKDKQTVTYFFFIVYRKEKRKTKKSKKSKTKEKRKIEPLTDFYPSLPQVSIPKNPSSFAVFAAIRNTCLENKRKQDTILQVSFDKSISDDNHEGARHCRKPLGRSISFCRIDQK